MCGSEHSRLHMKMVEMPARTNKNALAFQWILAQAAILGCLIERNSSLLLASITVLANGGIREWRRMLRWCSLFERPLIF